MRLCSYAVFFSQPTPEHRPGGVGQQKKQGMQCGSRCQQGMPEPCSPPILGCTLDTSLCMRSLANWDNKVCNYEDQPREVISETSMTAVLFNHSPEEVRLNLQMDKELVVTRESVREME